MDHVPNYAVVVRCGSEMKVIAVIDGTEEIRRVLTHLVKNGFI